MSASNGIAPRDIHSAAQLLYESLAVHVWFSGVTIEYGHGSEPTGIAVEVHRVADAVDVPTSWFGFRVTVRRGKATVTK